MTKPITAVLAEIPDLVAEVECTAAIGAPNPSVKVQIRRPLPDSRPPTDLAVIDLLRTDPLEGAFIGKPKDDGHDTTSHLLDRLGICCRLVAEERAEAGLPQPEPGYGTWAGVCRYLTATIDWWTSEPGVSEDVDWEVRQIWKTLRTAARAPRDEPIPLRCPVIGCGDRAELQPGGQWLLCDSGHRRDIKAEKMRFLSMQEWTLAQCRHKLVEHLSQSVHAKTMEAWVQRGKLTPVRHTRKGVAVYSFAAVMVLARHARKRSA